MGCKTAMFDLSVSMNCTKSQACPYVYCCSSGVIQNHTDLHALCTCLQHIQVLYWSSHTHAICLNICLSLTLWQHDLTTNAYRTICHIAPCIWFAQANKNIDLNIHQL